MHMEPDKWRGKPYATDKIRNNLLPPYERILGHLMDTPIRLLEIGVLAGGSCLLWSDFFAHPESKIIGVDIHLPDMSDEPQRWRKIVLEKCDQNDTRRLDEIATRFGPFDVIIDDASHRYRETLTCFQHLIKHVKPEGYYVIEDWAVGYFREAQHIFGDASGKTMVDLVANIVQGAPFMGLSGLEIILDNFKSLAFFRKGVPGSEIPRLDLSSS